MANISEDRKVILAPLREVPYETTFLLSEAKQDQSIKHRYWFDLPSQWTHQSNEDPIIGIRSIYFTKTNRFIKYSYKIQLIPTEQIEPIDTFEGTISHWFDGGDDTLKQVVIHFNNNWLTNGTRTSDLTDEEHEWRANEIQCYYGYDSETNKTNLYFGREILESDTVMIKDNEDFEIECRYWIEIEPISRDAQAFFNSTDAFYHITKVAIPIWSHHQCLVKSSIANNDKNNILGHTRNDIYTPLKYYRLSHDVKKFWIELYETRFHECPVMFPTKVYETDVDKKKEIDRDDLFIEAIVMLSTEGML